MLKLNCYIHPFRKSKIKLKGLFLMQMPSLIEFQCLTLVDHALIYALGLTLLSHRYSFHL